jgi:hypothetical protein
MKIEFSLNKHLTPLLFLYNQLINLEQLHQLLLLLLQLNQDKTDHQAHLRLPSEAQARVTQQQQLQLI